MIDGEMPMRPPEPVQVPGGLAAPVEPPPPPEPPPEREVHVRGKMAAPVPDLRVKGDIN